MKLYFTTEYTLKIKGTTCVIDTREVKLQEVDLDIPKDILKALETLPHKIELDVRILPATLFINPETKVINKREENDE